MKKECLRKEVDKEMDKKVNKKVHKEMYKKMYRGKAFRWTQFIRGYHEYHILHIRHQIPDKAA